MGSVRMLTKRCVDDVTSEQHRTAPWAENFDKKLIKETPASIRGVHARRKSPHVSGCVIKNARFEKFPNEF